MPDLVVTCPKGFWPEWIAEGDAAGDPPTGEEWGWYMDGRRPDIGPGDRLYIVAHGLLRGFAPVTALRYLSFDRAHVTEEQWRGGVGAWRDFEPGVKADQWCICRRADAVAVTIDQPIKGFRGWRRTWWSRELERPFPDWMTKGVAGVSA